MLPASVQIGSVAYVVERTEPSQGLSGETEWSTGRIVVSPRLQGEMAVGVFIHEVTHALVYAVGQHNDKLRGEEYVSSVGHVLHELARSNPNLLGYLTGDPTRQMPSTIALMPYTLDVLLVPREHLAEDELSNLSVDDLCIKVEAGLHPDMAAWEITSNALAFGLYRARATETGDRYADMVMPVAGLFIDMVRRNPAISELLLAPIQRDPSLQMVVNNDVQTLG